MNSLACYCLLFLPLATAAPQTLGKLEWKTFKPKDGAFSVQFPGTPVEQKKSIKGGQGTVEVQVYEVELKPGETKFLVGISEFPESAIKSGTEDKRLDNARDGAVTSSKGKLRREKMVLLDNYPGRELVIEIEGKATVLLRMYAVKNRLYQVVAVGTAEQVTSQDAAKFLSSFKLEK